MRTCSPCSTGPPSEPERQRLRARAGRRELRHHLRPRLLALRLDHLERPQDDGLDGLHLPEVGDDEQLHIWPKRGITSDDGDAFEAMRMIARAFGAAVRAR